MFRICCTFKRRDLISPDPGSHFRQPTSPEDLSCAILGQEEMIIQIPNAKTCREIGNGFKNLQITHLWRHIYWNLWTKIRNGNYKHTFAHDFCENMSKMLIGCSLQCCHTPGVVDTDRATDMNYLWRRRGRTITTIKKVVKNGHTTTSAYAIVIRESVNDNMRLKCKM